MTLKVTYVLFLNDMRASQIENVQPVFQAETPEELVALVDRERVEGYGDGQWSKRFRAGGPLEWYNDPEKGFGHITKIVVVPSQYVDCMAMWESQVNGIRPVSEIDRGDGEKG